MLRRARRLQWILWRFVSDLSGVLRYADRATGRAYLLAVASSVPQIVRSATLVPADGKMSGRTCSFEPLPGTVVEVRGEDFSAAREMYCRRVYFVRDGFGVSDGDTVVDLGANIGLFTTLAAVAGARTIAVEAQSGFLSAIQANLRRNNAEDRAEVVHALVGARTGVLSSDANRGSSREWGDEPERIGMPELLARCGVTTVDLLKVDIEGSEFDLFQEDSFLDGVRRIAMEVHPPHGDVAALKQRVEGHGFDVILLDSEGRETGELTSSRGGYLFAARPA